MPAGYDAEVAELFRDLRSASGLTEADLAAQLATRTEVVQALEQGALYALPPWPETYRVVATYGTLLNLDVRPLLRRIYAQVDAGVVGLAPKSMPDVPFMAPPENVEHEYQNQAPQAGLSGGGSLSFPSAAAGSAAAKGAAVSAGPARAAPPSAISAVSANAAPVSASSAAVTTAAAASSSATAMAAAAKGRTAAAIAHAASAAAAAAAQPSRTAARGKSPDRAAAASSQACARAARYASSARGPAGEEALAVEGDHQMGRGNAGHSRDRRGAVDLARPAKSAWLRQRSRQARRQIDEQRRADRPQRSAEPKGRSPSRPLIASPDLLDSST